MSDIRRHFARSSSSSGAGTGSSSLPNVTLFAGPRGHKRKAADSPTRSTARGTDLLHDAAARSRLQAAQNSHSTEVQECSMKLKSRTSVLEQPPSLSPAPSTESPIEDSLLQQALELSREEARLNAMSEEDLLQEAMRISEADMKGKAAEQEEEKGREVQPIPTIRPSKPKPIANLAPIFSPRTITSTSSESADAHSSENRDSLAPPIEVQHFSQTSGKAINRLDGSLNLIFWKKWIVPLGSKALMDWMLRELAWHRVRYTRPGTGFEITTPRWTTTFGRDDGPTPLSAYSITPRMFPQPLMFLKQQVEHVTGCQYNTVIINYYADGKDSISFHADDEHFLGLNPSIASLSLGSPRDFLLRRKAPAGVAILSDHAKHPMGTKGTGPAAGRPTEKLVLGPGDLLLMRGKTQAEWEHAVPKRMGCDQGRINLTFRKVEGKKGTENFQRYNRGAGPEYRFIKGRMVERGGGL